MGDVVNQKTKTIATKGSPHVAKSGPPDVNFLPGKKKTIAPPHNAPTKRATEHTTKKTVIAKKPIVKKGDKIGPVSNPAHAGTAGGVTNGAYRKEAKATSGSPNVKTEAKPPARNVDPTLNNKGNTTGTLQHPAAPPAAVANPRKPEERCSITEIVLECSHHGRQTTPKDPVLDVLQGDKVTATATRKNLLLPGEPAAVCPPAFKGRHPKTKFTITRTGPNAKDAKGPEPFEGIDEKKLAADWLGEASPKYNSTKDPLQSGKAAVEKSSAQPARDRQAAWKYENTGALGGDKVDAFGRTIKRPEDLRTTTNNPIGAPPAPVTRQTDFVNKQDQMFRPITGGIPQKIKDDAAKADAMETKNLQAAYDKNQSEAKAKAYIGAVRGVITGAVTVHLLSDLIDNVKAKPKVITINGQGCAGSVTRSLNVYPDLECFCDLMKFREVIAAFHALTMLFAAGQTFCNAIGFGGFTFKFLDPCSCEFKHAWKELEKDSKENVKLTKQRVNRELSLALGCNLIEFAAKGKIPVLQFVGGIPGAAKLASKLRDWFNIAADVVVNIKLAVAVKLIYSRNRYEETSIDFAFNPSIEVSIGISLQATKVGITLVVGVLINPTFTAGVHTTDYVHLQLLKGAVEFFVEGAVNWDVLGFKDEVKKRYTFGKVEYPETTLSLASWIS